MSNGAYRSYRCRYCCWHEGPRRCEGGHQKPQGSVQGAATTCAVCVRMYAAGPHLVLLKSWHRGRSHQVRSGSADACQGRQQRQQHERQQRQQQERQRPQQQEPHGKGSFSASWARSPILFSNGSASGRAPEGTATLKAAFCPGFILRTTPILPNAPPATQIKVARTRARTRWGDRHWPHGLDGFQSICVFFFFGRRVMAAVCSRKAGLPDTLWLWLIM